MENDVKFYKFSYSKFIQIIYFFWMKLVKKILLPLSTRGVSNDIEPPGYLNCGNLCLFFIRKCSRKGLVCRLHTKLTYSDKWPLFGIKTT